MKTNSSWSRRLLALAALAAGLLAVSGARAQGSFYAEEPKDGRIYVFNNMKSYDAWKKSGGAETGVAITRPGAGPNGETVVFDSDEAIHLYNFKHGNQGEVLIKKDDKKPTMKFGWKDGKTTFETDNAALVLSNRLQARYTFEDPDGEDNSKGSFRIRRAKTKFEGWFYKQSLTYELQLNWADTASSLEDVVLQWDVKGDKNFMVKVGQFKVPFGRQELTSSGSQQFVDRSAVSNEFEKGRDIGLQLWGTPMGGKLDWRLGVFNGAGRNKSSNDNDEYQYNGRLALQPWGDVKYSESDFESSDKPLLAVAANFEINDARIAEDPKTSKRELWGLDGVFKYMGFSATGEYFWRTLTPEGGEEYDSPGYYLQAGYLIVPKTFELAGRYGSWDPTDAKGDDDRIEWGIAGSWYYNKHNMKLQADWRRIEDKAKDSKNNELRVQTQFIF